MTATLTLTLNGQEARAPQGWTLRDLVAEHLDRPLGPDGAALDGRPLGVAVAVDDVVVPRSGWDGHVLAAGARVELVTPVQGG